MSCRLRKELESYKNGELELLRERLNSELHFLKSVSVWLLFLSHHHHTGLRFESKENDVISIKPRCRTLLFPFKKLLRVKRKEFKASFTFRATL